MELINADLHLRKFYLLLLLNCDEVWGDKSLIEFIKNRSKKKFNWILQILGFLLCFSLTTSFVLDQTAFMCGAVINEQGGFLLEFFDTQVLLQHNSKCLSSTTGGITSPEIKSKTKLIMTTTEDSLRKCEKKILFTHLKTILLCRTITYV